MNEGYSIALKKISYAKENNLSELNLSNLDLTELPIELFELTKLTKLKLNNNKLVVIPKEIEKLKYLNLLWLFNNQIKTIPYELIKISELRYLDLHGNKIISIEPWISKFKLKTLSLSYNQLKYLPENIEKLPNISNLFLYGNPFEDIPIGMIGRSFTDNCLFNVMQFKIAEQKIKKEKDKQTRSLDLSKLNLTDIPNEVYSLTHLQFLNINDNNISELTNNISRLKNLVSLLIYNNPIENIPLELIGKNHKENCLAAIKDYLRSVQNEEDTVKLYEAKLLLVGRGEVGKSELIEALTTDNYKFDKGRISTQGISIKAWNFKMSNELIEKTGTENFRVNVWDFGGQEIYRATHQFFLTKSSFYIFVWDARKEEDHLTFEYWLNVIQLLSDNSPILIVQNKADERTKEINQAEYKQAFSNILNFYKTSCLTGEGINQLKNDIQKAIVNLPHVGNKWNKNRVKIREILEKDNRDYIDYKEYVDICYKNGLREDEPDFLSDQLHKLGVLLHFQNDPNLIDTIILKPEWATQACYKVLDNENIKRAKRGKFSFDDLKTIWTEEKYIQKRPLLLNLMQRFELCFKLVGTDYFVVPEMLPAEMPQNIFNFSNPIRFEFHYGFMPEGIITRFICRNYKYIFEENFWQGGVLLNFENTKVLITSNKFERRIQILIQGKQIKEVLFIIRKDILDIHESLRNPKVDEMLPCNCEGCKKSKEPHFYEYSILKEYMNENIDEIRCFRFVKNKVSVRGLIEGIIDLQKEHEISAVTNNYYGTVIKDMKGQQVNVIDQMDNSSISKSDTFIKRLMRIFKK